jgi:hypothetical protein
MARVLVVRLAMDLDDVSRRRQRVSPLPHQLLRPRQEVSQDPTKSNHAALFAPSTNIIAIAFE